MEPEVAGGRPVIENWEPTYRMKPEHLFKSHEVLQPVKVQRIWYIYKTYEYYISSVC